MTRIALAIALAIGFTGCERRAMPEAPPRTVHVTVLLRPAGGGECDVPSTHPPRDLQARRGDRVIWTIVDLCKGTESDDVVLEFEGDNPTECRDPRGRQTIDCRIHADADDGTYKYDVVLGGLREDPEIEIVPF